jgi:hypothetical protein
MLNLEFLILQCWTWERATEASVIHLSYENAASSGSCGRKELKKVKSTKRDDNGSGPARQMRNRRILAGAGYFTPEQRNTTVVGAVWIDFTARLDDVMALKRCLALGGKMLLG